MKERDVRKTILRFVLMWVETSRRNGRWHLANKQSPWAASCWRGNATGRQFCRRQHIPCRTKSQFISDGGPLICWQQTLILTMTDKHHFEKGHALEAYAADQPAGGGFWLIRRGYGHQPQRPGLTSQLQLTVTRR
jgi:hypothetical protein